MLCYDLSWLGIHQGSTPTLLRTFQIDPKDLLSRRCQAECAGVAGALPEGDTMSERVEERQSWAWTSCGSCCIRSWVPCSCHCGSTFHLTALCDGLGSH